MKKIMFISVCLAGFIYSNTAFAESACAQLGVDCRPQGGGGYSCDEACQQARAERAEARAEAAAERARERAAYNKALNEAYQEAESSRKAAERSAGQAQSKTRELAQLRNSMIDAAKVDAANRRYRDAVRDQKEQTNQLDNLQRKIVSINVQISPSDASFGTAVRLNEEDLYKKISPVPVSPSVYQQAEKNQKAQLKELDELKKQSIFLSTYSQINEERIRLEKTIQLKAIFGAGLDLLNLPAPAFKNADKKLKVAYAATKSAVALIYTATAPDYVERTKKANESVNNLISLAALNPAWANNAELDLAIKGMDLSIKFANSVIDQDSKDKKNPVRIPEELYYDYIKQTLNYVGVFSPHVKAAHALISLKERTDQYIHAEDAIKQIRRMKEGGSYAKEYIEDRILVVDRNREASERILQIRRP